MNVFEIFISFPKVVRYLFPFTSALPYNLTIVGLEALPSTGRIIVVDVLNIMNKYLMVAKLFISIKRISITLTSMYINFEKKFGNKMLGLKTQNYPI